jgi:hypothetical protein
MPVPRHDSLDIRPLKLGSYNAGETSAASAKDLAVMRILTACRKSSHRPTDDVVLDEKEKELFDIDYSRHLAEVIEMQRKQRYVTEAEKAAIREARRPKKEEWRRL